ncbi:hypothetical protein SD70_15900 [Gordoniibacillus kamchatkensis]|uniref:SH3 domain-containing protein n=1 Tax=Gordoniibacillus kamchatkensis TaxID=1590651 RepID=A0ABR5AGJ1_9BACL|nr:hypothetical protein [Paenibacillus sp. VKM B-2647]KIL40149.1 hypothetical protein SD70_15900 [Paenibacillus sp. VKM B-2647]
MGTSERPAWYEELKKEPFEGRADAAEFVARIERRAFAPSSSGGVRLKAARLGAWTAAAASVLAAFWLFSHSQPGRHPVTDRTSSVLALNQQSMELRDDSRQDESLRAFLQQLNQTVKTKNADALLKAVDDNITVELLPHTVAGKAAFIEDWSLSGDSGNSKVWEVLSQLIISGGRLQDGQYSMPGGYYMDNSAVQADSRHTFLISFVAGSHLELYGEPDLQAQNRSALDDEEVVQEWISDEVLPVDLEGQTYRWVQVSTMTGKNGYVPSKFLHSDASYRLRLAKGADGVWKIALLANVNGDG